jgi:hypothetical protein
VALLPVCRSWGCLLCLLRTDSGADAQESERMRLSERKATRLHDCAREKLGTVASCCAGTLPTQWVVPSSPHPDDQARGHMTRAIHLRHIQMLRPQNLEVVGYETSQSLLQVACCRE